MSGPISVPSKPARTREAAFELDASQKASITTKAHAVLLTAGPGSGKTETLGRRLAYLIGRAPQSERVQPEQVLVLSYTNQGARDVVSRASRSGYCDEAVLQRVPSTTFHSFSAQVLRKHAPLLFGSRSFAIADTNTQQQVVIEAARELQMPMDMSGAWAVVQQISQWKQAGHSVGSLQRMSVAWTSSEQRALTIFPMYNNLLRQAFRADFGDLALLCLKLFHTHPGVLSEVRWRYRHVLVDEFQDTTGAQYALLHLLVTGLDIHDDSQGAFRGGEPTSVNNENNDSVTRGGDGSNGGAGSMNGVNVNAHALSPWVTPPGLQMHLFCCGDEDQRIYSWKGAQAGHMRRFQLDFPGAVLLSLPTSHRLPQHILASASQLLGQGPYNTQRSQSQSQGGGGGHGYFGSGQAQSPAADVNRDSANGAQGRSHSNRSGSGSGGITTKQAGSAYVNSNFESNDIGGVSESGTAATAEAPPSTSPLLPSLNYPMTSYKKGGGGGDGGGGVLAAGGMEAKITVMGHFDGRAEGLWIGTEAKRYHEAGIKWKDMACVVRTNNRMREVEECLLARGVPFDVLSDSSTGTSGSPSFYTRLELQGPLALLRLAVDSKNDPAFMVVASSTSLLQLGDTGWQTLRQIWREEEVTLVQAAQRAIARGMLAPGIAEKLADFLLLLRRWSGQLLGWGALDSEDKKLALLKQIFQEGQFLTRSSMPTTSTLTSTSTGATGAVREDRKLKLSSSERGVVEMATAACSFDSVDAFLLHVSLEAGRVSKGDQGTQRKRKASTLTAQGGGGSGRELAADGSDDGALLIVSMHQSKGREFDVVFLPGWEEGAFPLLNPKQEDKGAVASAVEEERRLAYVALTRARTAALISYVRRRKVDGRWTMYSGPSRFLGELPIEHLAISPNNTSAFYSGWRAGNFVDFHLLAREAGNVLGASGSGAKGSSHGAVGNALTPPTALRPELDNIDALLSWVKGRAGRPAGPQQPTLQLPQATQSLLEGVEGGTRAGKAQEGAKLSAAPSAAEVKARKGKAVVATASATVPTVSKERQGGMREQRGEGNGGGLPRVTVVPSLAFKPSKLKTDIDVQAIVDRGDVDADLVASLMKDRQYSQMSLRLLFRQVLAVQFGMKRGCIEVEVKKTKKAKKGAPGGERGETAAEGGGDMKVKAISQASATELGQALLELLE